MQLTLVLFMFICLCNFFVLENILLNSISQTIDSPLDEGMNCQNYPYKHFATYGACDKHFVMQEYRNKYKLMPFWITDKMKEVTKLRYLFYVGIKTSVAVGEASFIFPRIIEASMVDSLMGGELLDGTAVSTCPRPCLSTKVNEIK